MEKIIAHYYNLGKYSPYSSMRDAVMHEPGLCDLPHELLVCYEAGLRNAEMPYLVTGWRYGDIPACGYSYNYRDDRPEAGVSLMATDCGIKSQDAVSAMFISPNRPVVRVRGYLHTFRRGSDGEPLVLFADPIGGCHE